MPLSTHMHACMIPSPALPACYWPVLAACLLLLLLLLRAACCSIGQSPVQVVIMLVELLMRAGVGMG